MEYFVLTMVLICVIIDSAILGLYIVVKVLDKALKKEGYSIAEKVNPSKKDILFASAVLAIMVFLIYVWVGEIKKEYLKDYDNGKVVKEITYRTKTIGGEVVKTDSTYVYKRKK